MDGLDVDCRPLCACSVSGIAGSSYGQLQLNFYAKSCPQAEKIIQDYVQKQIPNAPSLAAALLRRLLCQSKFPRLLSGAHTIGVSHCPPFSSRLYNFTGVWGKQDPSLDSEYAANLKMKKCKSINDNSTIVEMDPGSSSKFDLSYFQLVLKRKGLFQSDAALTTKSFINQLVQGSLKQFYAEFGLAMEKMGKIEVKTGSAGEIRKHCTAVNS
ncbi:hypothetical protein KY290_031658 [Solanum tuberosum]|uniref:peroxidase n=1 Tax=Solanum tuberosum TaxID=4113 RepID=A0ABQ7U9U6_SOLTU|nr:hypothetical protein KY284_030720 [Solanum tuberosum]KAH0653370.1 hypothetical protein KY289_031048 [Solanum tuberosum]KAH0743665.1 hypothetical protein KY290_031658 [Solanum tuberosum]